MNSSQCLHAISSAFPELGITQVTPLGEGWANWSFECPEGLVFRFPKNAQSAAELDAITPLNIELNPQLSLPSPHYIHQGVWRGLPFVGYKKIPGVPLVAAQLKAHSNRIELCQQLGIFLSELHTFPMEKVRSALPHSLQNPWMEECTKTGLIGLASKAAINESNSCWIRLLILFPKSGKRCSLQSPAILMHSSIQGF